MGTSGLIKIIFKNKLIGLYNHCDSHPKNLGYDLIYQLINLLKKYSIEELIKEFEKIKIVDNETIPTEEDIKKLEPYTDLGVSNQSTSDWYCLLRLAQGSITDVLKSGYALNNEGSDYENYIYIIDLNERNFKYDK